MPTDEKVRVFESERRAIRMLVDETEAYLSAVGEEDANAAKLRWAIARATALVARAESRHAD